MFRIVFGFFLGLAVAGAAASQSPLIPRGPLVGWEVQFDGKVICTEPMAYPDFHASGHSIIDCGAGD